MVNQSHGDQVVLGPEHPHSSGSNSKVLKGNRPGVKLEDLQPNFGVTSVNYDFAELLARAAAPA